MRTSYTKSQGAHQILAACKAICAGLIVGCSGMAMAGTAAGGRLQFSYDIRDDKGNLVAPTFQAGSNTNTTVQAHLNAVGNNALNSSRVIWNTTFSTLNATAPGDPAFDFASKATFSGGLTGAYVVSGHSQVAGSYVNAYSGSDYYLMIPAHGSLSLVGSASATVSSSGFDPNGIGQSAYADVRLVVSPQFQNGNVFGDTVGAASTASAPGLDAHSFDLQFSQLYENTYDYPVYIGFLAMSYFTMTNSVAAAVPEPDLYMLWLGGLGALALAGRKNPVPRTA